MISPGTRLGPYEVLSPLGHGGMGQVFRARDSRLDRTVAVKVVAADAASPHAFERFSREAKAVAAIHHPNICSIYDLGTEPVPFVVMELLEGESLYQRLMRGPLDLPSLIDTALPLADALVAVHAKGIIHRDLKPANIFLTPYGPKILDFGLARITGPDPDGSDVTMQPTVPAQGPLTGAGMTVGTVGYMSPEQLRAAALDSRTDLFSLGAVLYEMTTGRPAFAGSTPAVTSGAILHQQAVPPRQVRPDVPQALEDIILKLLEKDRDVRTQTASELRAELTRLKRSSDPAHSASSATAAPAPVADGETSASRSVLAKPPVSSDAKLLVEVARRHRLTIVAAAALVVAVVTGSIYFIARRPTASPTAVSDRLSIADLQVAQLTTSDTAAAPAISPDGKYVAYVEQGAAGNSLRVRQIVAESTVEIVPPEPGATIRGATVSPDGTAVYYVRQLPPNRSELWRIPFLGGTPRRVLADCASLVSWSPDGSQMAFVRADGGQSQVVVAGADGTNERVLATRRVPELFWSFRIPLGSYVPAWSPDGRTLALLGARPRGRNAGEVVLIDVATGALHSFEAGPPLLGSSVGWLDNGTLVVSMLKQSSEPLQLWLMSSGDGRLRRLTNDVNQYASISLTADRDQLVTGRAAFAVGVWTSDASGTRWSQVVPTFPQKGPVGFGVAWAGNDLIYAGAPNGKFGLVRWRAATRQTEMLAPAAGAPLVSADGSIIVYFDYDTGERSRVDAEGRSRVTFGRDGVIPSAITPDGQQVLYRTGAGVIRVQRTDGSQDREFAPGVPLRGEQQFAVSSDGQWVALEALDGQQQPVTLVCDVATCSSRRTLPPVNGYLHWTPDDSAIGYVQPTTASNIRLQPVDGSPSRQLTNFPEDAWRIWDFAWSADGRLAVARAQTFNNIVLIKGLQGQEH